MTQIIFLFIQNTNIFLMTCSIKYVFKNVDVQKQ